MMPDSSERAMTLGGPRSRLEVAVSLLSAAVEQFAKHGDMETWVKHIPPATRGPGAVASSASAGAGGMGGFSRPGGNMGMSGAHMGYGGAGGAGAFGAGMGMGGGYSMGSYGGGGSGSGMGAPSHHRGPNMAGSGGSSGLGSALGLQQSPEAYQIAMSVPIVSAAVSGAYSLGPGQIQVEVSIPHATAGAVIGRAGSVINELIRQSGAQVLCRLTEEMRIQY